MTLFLLCELAMPLTAMPLTSTFKKFPPLKSPSQDLIQLTFPMTAPQRVLYCPLNPPSLVDPTTEPSFDILHYLKTAKLVERVFTT